MIRHIRFAVYLIAIHVKEGIAAKVSFRNSKLNNATIRFPLSSKHTQIYG